MSRKAKVEDKAINAIRRFSHLSDRCLDRIQKHVPEHELESPGGKYAARYFTICSCMSHIYLSVGKFETSKRLFSAALEYTHTTQEEEPNGLELLRLLRGLATSCQKTGDLTDAQDVLQSALKLAESTCGHMSDEAVEIDSQLKAVRESISVELDNRKRALVASTGDKRGEPETPLTHSHNNGFMSPGPAKGVSSSTGSAQESMESGSEVSCEILLAEPSVFLPDSVDKDNALQGIPSRSTLLRGKLRLKVRKNVKIKSVNIKFRGKTRMAFFPDRGPPVSENTLLLTQVVTANHDEWETRDGNQRTYSHTASNISTTFPGSALSSYRPAQPGELATEGLKRLQIQPIYPQSSARSMSSLDSLRVRSKGYRIFYPGTYENSFEFPIHHHLPETTDLYTNQPYAAAVRWKLKAVVERAETFKPRLCCTKGVTVVRVPGQCKDRTAPSRILGRWESQMRFDISISGQYFPIGSMIPITLQLAPITNSQVRVHKLTVLITESIKCLMNDGTVYKKEKSDVLLLEKILGQPLGRTSEVSDSRVLGKRAVCRARCRETGLGLPDSDEGVEG